MRSEYHLQSLTRQGNTNGQTIFKLTRFCCLIKEQTADVSGLIKAVAGVGLRSGVGWPVESAQQQTMTTEMLLSEVRTTLLTIRHSNQRIECLSVCLCEEPLLTKEHFGFYKYEERSNMRIVRRPCSTDSIGDYKETRISMCSNE